MPTDRVGMDNNGDHVDRYDNNVDDSGLPLSELKSLDSLKHSLQVALFVLEN